MPEATITWLANEIDFRGVPSCGCSFRSVNLRRRRRKTVFVQFRAESTELNVRLTFYPKNVSVWQTIGCNFGKKGRIEAKNI